MQGNLEVSGTGTVEVRDEGVSQGRITVLDFVGAGVTVSASGIISTVTIAGATPGGSNTQVQFNDSSAFGGDAGLTFDKTNDILTVGARIRTGDGTAALPALAPTSDTNTGIYFDALDEVFVATAGVKRLTFNDFGLGIHTGSSSLGVVLDATAPPEMASGTIRLQCGKLTDGFRARWALIYGTANQDFGHFTIAESGNLAVGTYAEFLRYSNATTGVGFYNAGALVILNSNKPIALATNTGTTRPDFYVDANGNIGISTDTFGTSATQALGVKTGVAPSTSPADLFQMYSVDQAAGNAVPEIRSENGSVYRLWDFVGDSGSGGTKGLVPAPAAGDSTKFLKGNGTWETPVAATHALLDGSTHTDTVAQTVTRGSLVYGNATPKWDELVVGAANTVVKTDGIDPSWALIVNANIDSAAAIAASKLAPPGSNTQIIFNDTGAFAGDAGLTFDKTNDNLGLGVASFGTGAVKVFSIVSGTAPSTSPVDLFQMYSADIVAGDAAPHFRTENGSVIKLFKSAAYTPTNITTDRSYDANSTTIDELADVLGTLIVDLQATGLIG